MSIQTRNPVDDGAVHAARGTLSHLSALFGIACGIMLLQVTDPLFDQTVKG
jgi:hypothetical protein